MPFFKNIFTSNNSSILDFSELETDIHSHFIPGIDDGCKSIDESINLLKQIEGIGFKRIICTPHIQKEFYKNSENTIRAPFEKLQKAVKDSGINLELHYAAEYLIDAHFEELIEKNEILHFGNKCVLTELSYFTPYRDFKNIINKLQNKGYTVILAHPERYSYWHRNLKTLEDLHKQGVLLQVNIPSLSSYYGSTVRKQAITLIKEGLIDLAGTDIHNQRYVNAVLKTQNDKTFQNALENGIFKNKLLFN